MRHMLGNLSPNYFERTKRYMMLRASQQGTDLTVSGTPPLSLPNSLGKPLKAWSVDLLPYQEGTGDPAPDNVRPIHGTDKVTVWTSGSNLFDKTAITPNSWINVNSTTIGYNTGYCVSDYIPVIKGASYWMMAKGSSRCAYYDADKNGIAYFGNDGSDIAYFVPLYDGYVRITISAQTNLDTYMFATLPLGSDYVPYLTPSQTVLTLPSTVYTATIGSDGGESRDAARVFNGTENWFKETGVIGGGFWLQFDDMARMSNYCGAIICDKLTTYAIYNANAFTSAESGITGYPINTLYAGQNWIYAKAPNCTTANEFKAWLSQNPITVVYPLATPTTFAVPSVTIPTPRGTATTWATAEDGTVDGMKVTYVGKA